MQEELLVGLTDRAVGSCCEKERKKGRRRRMGGIGQASADKGPVGQAWADGRPRHADRPVGRRPAKQSARVQPTGTFRPNPGRRGPVGPVLADAVLFLEFPGFP